MKTLLILGAGTGGYTVNGNGTFYLNNTGNALSGPTVVNSGATGGDFVQDRRHEVAQRYTRTRLARRGQPVYPDGDRPAVLDDAVRI